MNRRQVLGFAIGPLAAGLLSLGSLPVMTWIFPPDMIGKLSMLQVATNLSTLLCCLGLDQAYVREFHESSDKPGLFLNATAPGLAVLLGLLIGLAVFAPGALSSLLFNERNVEFSLIVALCLVAVYLSRFLSLILRMQDRGFAYSMSQVLSKLLLLLIVLGYVWFSTSHEFIMLLAAQSSALVLTFAVFAWNTRRDWWPAIHARLDRAKVTHLLGFGWPLVFGGVASWGLAAIDRVFLRSMSTYDELAVYSVAATMASAVTVFTGVFNTIWSPAVYQWVADKADMKRVDAVGSQMVVLGFLLVCLTGGCSWVLRIVLPSPYVSVSYLVVGCVVPPLLYTLSEVTGIGITISRRTRFATLASFGAVLVNLILCYVLIPLFGASGAMVATACSLFVFFVLRTEFSSFLWRRTSNVEYYGYAALSLALALTYALIGPQFPVSSIIGWWLILAFVSILRRATLSSLWSFARAKGGE